jgi:hypothetical protein
MSAEHVSTETIDKSAVNGQALTKDEFLEVDGDEDSGDEAVPQGESTNPSSKKKKKKKPKKKVSHQYYSRFAELNRLESSYESFTWLYTPRDTSTTARIGRRQAEMGGLAWT